MKLSMFVKAVAATALAGAVCVTLAAAGGQGSDKELQARIAALEAGQKAILKELQEIKVLLQARPAVPTPMPAPAAAAPQPSPASNPTAPPNFDLDIAGAATRGRPDAKLVVIEFSDFQCPFCGRYTRETLPQVERDYVDTGKIRYVFRHFPLERLHPLALRAAEAGDCANQQGKFWPMHTRLFGNQQALAEADLSRAAEVLGLNMPAFQQCMKTQSTSPVRVRQDQTEGSRAAITGTPTFFIGTLTPAGKVHVLKRLVGAQPYTSFKTALDALLSAPERTP
jgi:protein-disulfide isomerase